MAEIFSPFSGGAWWDGPEATEHFDPTLDRRTSRRSWEVRSAQWRAWELAEAAFGEAVCVALAGGGEYQSLRGLLTLQVPFRDLPDHRRRESLFLAWAGRDPVLSRVPLIFVFEPTPLQVPR